MGFGSVRRRIEELLERFRKYGTTEKLPLHPIFVLRTGELRHWGSRQFGGWTDEAVVD